MNSYWNKDLTFGLGRQVMSRLRHQGLGRPGRWGAAPFYCHFYTGIKRRLINLDQGALNLIDNSYSQQSRGSLSKGSTSGPIQGGPPAFPGKCPLSGPPCWAGLSSAVKSHGSCLPLIILSPFTSLGSVVLATISMHGDGSGGGCYGLSCVIPSSLYGEDLTPQYHKM